MNLAERIKNAETHQFRMVYPCSLNDNNIFFGGTALKWMDEVAYITAQRFSKMKMVTVSIENVNFHKAIYQGTMVEIIGKVSNIRNVKIDVGIEVFIENRTDGNREIAIDGVFTFAVINENNKPVRINLANVINS
jgi:acyl-CoA hydrolase